MLATTAHVLHATPQMSHDCMCLYFLSSSASVVGRVTWWSSFRMLTVKMSHGMRFLQAVTQREEQPQRRRAPCQLSAAASVVTLRHPAAERGLDGHALLPPLA